MERKRHADTSVISAHTKIWAAEEVENAIKRAGEPVSAALQGSVPVNAVPAAGAGVPSAAVTAPESGMKELSPVQAPIQQKPGAGAAAVPQPVQPAPEVQSVPEAQAILETQAVPETQYHPAPQSLPESQPAQTGSSAEVHTQPEVQPAVMPEEQAQPVRTDYNTQPAQQYSQPQQETAPQAPAYPEPEASYGPEERNDSAAYVL